MATQSRRSIATLQISPAHRSKLMKNGYTTVADIHAVSVEELSRDLGLPLEDANAIVAATQPQSQLPIQNPFELTGPSPTQRAHISIAGSQTAAQLLKVPASATALSLGVKAIDELLEGGALKGSVLEISGVPGSGRSAAVRSVLTSATKAGYDTLIIDSRGDFSLDILRNMAETMTDDAGGKSQLWIVTTRPDLFADERNTTSLHYVRTTSLPELLSCISTLPQYCGNHPSIKLVALSHLSYHVQSSNTSPQVRGKLLTLIKQHLTKTCVDGQVAVVATTSMAVKLVDDQGQPANFSTGTKALLLPALGDAFSLASKTYRIVLARQPHDGQRFARLVTSPVRTNQGKTVDFMIKSGLLTDMEVQRGFSGPVMGHDCTVTRRSDSICM